MKVKNQPVGTVECSHKGCTETCNVFKFRPRAEGGRRTVFTDKLYFECPTHGRIGSDGNPTVTEYILCNAKMASAPATADGQKNRAPARTPAPTPARSSAGAPAPSSTRPSTETSSPAPPARTPWRTLIDLE